MEALGKPKERELHRVGAWEYETQLGEGLWAVGCSAGAVVNGTQKEPLCFD